MRIKYTAAISLLCLILLWPGTIHADQQRDQRRNYVLVFDMTSYSPQLGDAVDSFFKRLFKSGDRLIVVTPSRLLGYSQKSLSVPPRKLSSRLIKTLKADITLGSVGLRDIFQSMMGISQTLSRTQVLDDSIVPVLENYLQLRKNLKAVRGSYQDRLMKYVRYFGGVDGDNHLVFFLQRQFRPIPDNGTLNMLRSNTKLTGFKAAEAFLDDTHRDNFDFFEVHTRFQYARLTFHFILLNDKRLKFQQGLRYLDDMGNVYSRLSKLSRATGGVQLTTATPAFFVTRLHQILRKGNVQSEVVEQRMGK